MTTSGTAGPLGMGLPRVELAVAAYGLVQAAVHGLAFAEEAFDVLLDEGLAVLEHEDFVNLVVQLVEHVEGQGVLGDLHHGIGATAAGEVLLQVVVGDAGGDDAAALVGAGDVLVEAAFLGGLGEAGLLVDEVAVEALGVDRQQHVALGVAGAAEGVLLADGLALDAGAAVGQAGGDAHQDGGAQLLAEVVAGEDHVVGLLLVRRLEHRDHGPVTVVAAVLLVLAGEHAGVVGHHDDDALGADDGGVHEGVAADVEAHVLHAGHGAFAAVGHADRGLEGGLLVGAPVGDNTLFLGLFALHHIFGNLGRRGTGVAVDGATASIDKCLCNSLVA